MAAKKVKRRMPDGVEKALRPSAHLLTSHAAKKTSKVFPAATARTVSRGTEVENVMKKAARNTAGQMREPRKRKAAKPTPVGSQTTAARGSRCVRVKLSLANSK